MIKLIIGDALDELRKLPSESVHCVVTSPPYFGLRDYGTASWEGGDPACEHIEKNARNDVSADDLARRAAQSRAGTGEGSMVKPMQFKRSCNHCGATRTDKQIGLEPTPAEFVLVMVEVFREVRRVLRKDGTLWLNLGDSYAAGPMTQRENDGERSGGTLNGRYGHVDNVVMAQRRAAVPIGLKPKDLIGIPWRVAFALQADGWYLRQDIVWCLSGGTRVYARTQKGEMPMTIKDMVRLDPSTVQLWNGEKWTQVLGWSATPRPDKTYEIELRNGQRIGCTAGHLWPAQRCTVRTDQIAVGDVIATCRLPEPPMPKRPAALPDEVVGWFVGLYIAEGSRSDGTINIASHTKEAERFARLKATADAFHATAAIHKTSDFGCTVALNGPMLNGLIDTYVSGRIASDKHLHPRCWQRSDTFLRAVLEGYLSGDGHWDTPNERWRLGFCTNDELVADLRTIGARLGISVRLKRSNHTLNGDSFPGYRGELRYKRSDHHNSRDDGEVVAIRESRARKFWDIGVADEPHTFALASGVLTHNSKPNPMPESVTDRCTKSHEYIFLLSKSARYFYDAEAIAEIGAGRLDLGTMKYAGRGEDQSGWHDDGGEREAGTRNRRSVWTVATQPFSQAHFATFPPALIEPCIKAGCPKDCCAKCGAPVVREVECADAPTGPLGRSISPTHTRRLNQHRAALNLISAQESPRQSDGRHPAPAMLA